ncbi:hypothetical protein SKAU_G00203770 [Synaphobranchus kaupii]|uniref:Uncharacterized protein n=1 Tax=Synaphobranchus kaupii TaxID=118154 RepID=A0A9Q1FGH8_SYNKA|nr:hypothetical protein SKAU_G00203770 [Synaphobranchus kaupii]
MVTGVTPQLTPCVSGPISPSSPSTLTVHNNFKPILPGAIPSICYVNVHIAVATAPLRSWLRLRPQADSCHRGPIRSRRSRGLYVHASADGLLETALASGPTRKRARLRGHARRENRAHRYIVGPCLLWHVLPQSSDT